MRDDTYPKPIHIKDMAKTFCPGTGYIPHVPQNAEMY